jgi:LPXTG-site transpeptidase (sortase) family protein
MNGIVAAAARLVLAGRRIREKKAAFFVLAVAIFLASVSLLARLDLLPEASQTATADTGSPAVTLATSTPETPTAEEPVTVSIPAISLSAAVANPTTTDATALDALLLKGAVRYPTSAKLGENGNVVLFGHSSYLPVVYNQAYKTFDGIQKLATGDTITVSSATTVYTYRVRSMERESAASDAGIDLAVSGKVLTLVTCNSFATKSDRFVVTADFVESHPIANAS